MTITLKAIQTNTAANNTDVEFIFGDNGHFLAVVQFWRNLHIKKFLSTGFYFVNSALAMCDSVHVYGFWPFDTSIDGRRVHYHYFDDITFKKAHDMTTEFRTIVAMHQLGLLRLHVGNCTDLS